MKTSNANPSTPERSARELAEEIFLQTFSANELDWEAKQMLDFCAHVAESYCSSRLAAERERLAQEAENHGGDDQWAWKSVAAWLRGQ